MADDLSVAIERLRTSTQRLNTACDTAAQTVRDTEAFLSELHVGVPAFVEVEEGGFSTRLAYDRHKTGEFRILVAMFPTGMEEPEFVNVRPWAEWSRDVKLETFEKLPALLVEVARLVDESTTKAEKTVSEVSSLVQLPKKRKGG